MGISQIGESYSYIYNAQTGKLRTKDGTQDDFVDYFNGDLKGGNSDTLNGIDRARKAGFDRLINIFGHVNPNLFTGSETGEYEITAKQIDGASAEYSVNGKKVCSAYAGKLQSSESLRSALATAQPYKTKVSKGYDPFDNSINLAVGDSFDLRNGYRLVVGEDSVYVERYGDGNDGNEMRANLLAWNLSALIHFADGQWSWAMIDEACTPMLLNLLEELGVDTDKEFIINGTKCKVQDGRILGVENPHAAPDPAYNAMVKRYEEMLYTPLSEKNR